MGVMSVQNCSVPGGRTCRLPAGTQIARTGVSSRAVCSAVSMQPWHPGMQGVRVRYAC